MRRKPDRQRVARVSLLPRRLRGEQKPLFGNLWQPLARLWRPKPLFGNLGDLFPTFKAPVFFVFTSHVRAAQNDIPDTSEVPDRSPRLPLLGFRSPNAPAERGPSTPITLKGVGAKGVGEPHLTNCLTLNTGITHVGLPPPSPWGAVVCSSTGYSSDFVLGGSL